jgi:hypothetical protein
MNELIAEVLVQEFMKSKLFYFRKGVYRTEQGAGVVHKVDTVVVVPAWWEGGSFSLTENVEVIVILRGHLEP